MQLSAVYLLGSVLICSFGLPVWAQVININLKNTKRVLPPTLETCLVHEFSGFITYNVDVYLYYAPSVQDWTFLKEQLIAEDFWKVDYQHPADSVTHEPRSTFHDMVQGRQTIEYCVKLDDRIKYPWRDDEPIYIGITY